MRERERERRERERERERALCPYAAAVSLPIIDDSLRIMPSETIFTFSTVHLTLTKQEPMNGPMHTSKPALQESFDIDR